MASLAGFGEASHPLRVKDFLHKPDTDGTILDPPDQIAPDDISVKTKNIEKVKKGQNVYLLWPTTVNSGHSPDMVS